MAERLHEMNPVRQELSSDMFTSMWKYYTFDGQNSCDYLKELERLKTEIIFKLEESVKNFVHSEEMALSNAIYMGFYGYTGRFKEPPRAIVKKN